MTAITLLASTPSLMYSDGEVRKVSGKLAIVLGRLAVMPGKGVPRTHLINAAWSDGNGTSKALNDVLKKLRNEFGVPIPVAARGVHHYMIDIDRSQVDATLFMDGVDEVAERADLDKIDELLASWQEQQQTFTGYEWRQPVERHHRQLIEVVRELTEAQRHAVRSAKR